MHDDQTIRPVPRTVISVVTQRTRRLRTLYLSGIMTVQTTFLRPLTTESRAARTRRDEPADEADQERHGQAQQGRRPGDVEERQEPAGVPRDVDDVDRATCTRARRARPPIPATSIASASTRERTSGLLKPIALSTAISVVRSRSAIAIALPATQISETTTARPIVPDQPLQVADHLGEHLAERLLGLGPGGRVAVDVRRRRSCCADARP